MISIAAGVGIKGEVLLGVVASTVSCDLAPQDPPSSPIAEKIHSRDPHLSQKYLLPLSPRPHGRNQRNRGGSRKVTRHLAGHIFDCIPPGGQAAIPSCLKLLSRLRSMPNTIFGHPPYWRLSQSTPAPTMRFVREMGGRRAVTTPSSSARISAASAPRHKQP